MNRCHFTIVSCLSALLMAAASGRAALADPLGDLKNAALSTAGSHSYHFKMTSPAIGNSEGDLLFPGTLHETMANGMEMIVLPSASYVKINGKWMKYPGGGDIAASANQATVLAKMNAAKYHVTDLGMRPFGGSTMHAYEVNTTSADGKPFKSTDYVDGTGRLAGLSFGAMTMVLSNFGEQLHIVAPL